MKRAQELGIWMAMNFNTSIAFMALTDKWYIGIPSMIISIGYFIAFLLCIKKEKISNE